jgi:hypothetical protein
MADGVQHSVDRLLDRQYCIYRSALLAKAGDEALADSMRVGLFFADNCGRAGRFMLRGTSGPRRWVDHSSDEWI